MPKRRWTVVFLPPRNEASRTYVLPEWTLRGIAWTAAIGIILIVAAGTVLFTPWGTPGSRLVAAQNEALKKEIALIERRYREIDDTLKVIAERADQMRMLAGMPIDTPATPVSPNTAALLPASLNSLVPGAGVLTDRRRPFLGRLGWTSRPDIEGLIERATGLSKDFRLVSDTLEANYRRFASTPSILPTRGWLSSQFTRSRFHPILHENRPHKGIDVTAPTGTPIVAPAAGRVVFAGSDKGFGLTVEIDHGNGIRTRFAHCSRLAVKKGQQVTRGQLIAAVGSTGLSTSAHLHYEIHVDGQPVDPLKYVLPEASSTFAGTTNGN
jgi:murein DD-endopeptidase MepM/ murein hydrolase activator NlpD